MRKIAAAQTSKLLRYAVKSATMDGMTGRAAITLFGMAVEVTVTVHSFGRSSRWVIDGFIKTKAQVDCMLAARMDALAAVAAAGIRKEQA